jgi:asparagine synthase (glutamine-hydrolysing)
MCGIVGAFGNHVNKLECSFQSAVLNLSHRGPDAQNYKVINKKLLLGHSRLSILDLDHRADQPMIDKKGNTLVFNGEVYNFQELKNDLSEYHFITSSDTEVLLYCIDKYGIGDALKKINGMFAFLYWDEDKKELIAARDRLGKKPLFYVKKNNQIFFASEAKVFSEFDIDFEVNESAIVNFLFDRRVGSFNSNFFQNVASVKPGYFNRCHMNNNKVHIEEIKYWGLDDIVVDKNITYKDAKEEFYRIFNDSINLRMISDVPIAFMLSGGLDSSSIVSLAAKSNPKKEIFAISAVYPGSVYDESKYAIEVVNKYKNIKKEFIDMDGDTFFKYLDKTIYAQETPIADGSMVAHNILMHRISELGFKVLLSGNGGDEILSGYPTHKHAYFAQQFKSFKFNDLSFNKIKFGLYHCLPSKIKARVKYYLAKNKGFLLDNSKLKLLDEYYDSTYNHGDLVNFYLKMSLVSWSIPGFVWYEDRNAMNYGIEARAPFLDYRLVEFLLSLPGSYKIDDFFTKKILRDTMTEILPNKVLYRQDKEGFHSPIDEYIDYIDDKVFADEEFIKCFHYLNIDAIIKSGFLYKWRLFAIYKWFDIFIRKVA